MKQLLTSILVLFILPFSFFVKANVYQQLTSGHLSQIKLASQTMAAGRENTKENADILAEILLSKYENALSIEVDTLSWACKALAATNDGRYRNLLINIANSKTHKKLRKYAKSSFKKLPKSQDEYKRGSIELSDLQAKESTRLSKAKPILPKASLSKTERMLFVIAKGDLRSIKYIAQGVVDKGETDGQIADALSEFILNEYLNATEYQIDTLAWICRALGQLNNGRYTQVMEMVSEKSNASKIRSYARDAYNDLPKVENSYVKGTVDFNAIIQKYKA
ncbi:hypothetical protein [Pseudocolwellia agarivorans]|uniref:hypothetical protein n=1 Tax=Pseudocolwellia agarivorans TaxID=1911682 RepID=UPI000987CF32|nr:hypothetical protein [Pseudocolwellia agarivorans]